MKKGAVIRGAVAAVLLGAIAFSGYHIWMIQNSYAAEADSHRQLLAYQPTSSSGSIAEIPSSSPPDSSSSSCAPLPDSSCAPEVEVNAKIADLQAQYPAAVGWLSVPGTKIDYPFAQTTDNAYYLERGLDGGELTSGTIFMDHRNQPDFSDFNTLLYGHHMKNGSMFGTLKYFGTQSFFDTHETGTISLLDTTYEIDFFAYLVLKADDAWIYNPARAGSDPSGFLAYVKGAARYYRDIGVTADGRVVTLSSCA